MSVEERLVRYRKMDGEGNVQRVTEVLVHVIFNQRTGHYVAPLRLREGSIAMVKVYRDETDMINVDVIQDDGGQNT